MSFLSSVSGSNSFSTTDTVEVFPCPECYREFPTINRRNQHMGSTGHKADRSKKAGVSPGDCHLS